jgi:hypothetical protein
MVVGANAGLSGKAVSFRESEHPALRDLDIRDPHTTMSMYHEFTKPYAYSE